MAFRAGISQLLILAFLVSCSCAFRTREQDASKVSANPIRRVVTMLQAMQKKVSEESEKEKILYEKFMCYCKSNGGTLNGAIEAAEKKVPSVSSDIETAESQKSGMEEEFKQAQVDRSAAKSAQAEATAIREKEAAAFSAEKAEYDANIAAVNKAVVSLSKGIAGGFLQTGAAQVLKRLILGKQDMIDADRQELLAFLSASQGSQYVPQSGEITGILKEMGEKMEKGLADATATEQDSIKAFDELMAAKSKEVAALSASIESKTKRIGELAVEIVQMKDDLSDTQTSLLEDKKFLDELEKGCATKTSEWEEIVKTRADELAAVAETIKILNDDDALELFKKTLPSPGAASFVQMGVNTQQARSRASAVLKAATSAANPDHLRFDLIEVALKGKKVGFEKVIKMVDEMLDILKKEQLDDDHKKEYCNGQLDTTDDKKKSVARALSDEEAAIATAEDGITALKEEIASLEAGIRSLDNAVAEATEQRKEENKAFSELMASNSAAKELLGVAKNRLNRFYNPKLYKAPSEQELTAQQRISVNMGVETTTVPPPTGIAGTGITVFAEVSARLHRKDAPPPETFDAYSKKGQESTGVISMIDLLIKDLDKEMTEAQTGEKDAQADYETAMKDAAEKRTADSTLLTEKGSMKAELEADLESHKSGKRHAASELAATLSYIQSLHVECDWLLQNFDVRKEARSGEIDSLAQAKAVLNGADYSLSQGNARGFLRGVQ
eukprot:CAMPEP_0197884024 /NCGR_PEP_ID=MMETSP1439-20131203/10622_1 /TAXON_ID=66791 /ORGANISM="Gonyaulax spinifera, Strain CCMP409" /LENGTH=728 /DNA_ID=CAMNT_0043503755 /DNA_START=64 /DNA_END=2250 /DNA_ORIENTATION=-